MLVRAVFSVPEMTVLELGSFALALSQLNRFPGFQTTSASLFIAKHVPVFSLDSANRRLLAGSSMYRRQMCSDKSVSEIMNIIPILPDNPDLLL